MVSARSPFNTERRRDERVIETEYFHQVTMVNGRTFTVANDHGELVGATTGTIFEDLRMLSHLRVHVAPGGARERLALDTPSPFHTTVVTRPIDADGARELIVHRQWIGRGARHDIEVHNTHPTDSVQRSLTVEIDTDFAHLFDVKDASSAGRATGSPSVLSWNDDAGHLEHPGNAALRVAIRSSSAPDTVDTRSKALVWNVVVPPSSSTTIALTFEPIWDGTPAGLLYPLGTLPPDATPALRLRDWHENAPLLVTDDARLAIAFERCLGDLASLRIFDPAHPEHTVIAAGAPWFMTLFGRDSLITSHMILPWLPELAVGVLHELADLQGTRRRRESEEEPGRIIHELRRHSGHQSFADRDRYYGTVDATPLFVIVADETEQWGHLPPGELDQIWPHVRAALDWIVGRLDSDPNGLLTYARATPSGLANQGWKDSWDGVNFANGEMPTGPIALVEAQGYAYAALRAGARLARRVDAAGIDPDVLEHRASRLQQRFDDLFWMPRANSYAIGLTTDGTQIDSVTTNPGHAVWAGICDTDRANRYLDRIIDDDLWSGWGLRTLSPGAHAYDPLSYHNGSVWPHDTAIVAAGARRVARRDVVDVLAAGAFDCAEHFDGRPPELFAGLARDLVGTPVSYPGTCSPQAWSSASILLHVQSLLGLAPPASIVDPPRLDPAWATSGIDSMSGLRVGSVRYGFRTDPVTLETSIVPDAHSDDDSEVRATVRQQ